MAAPARNPNLQMGPVGFTISTIGVLLSAMFLAIIVEWIGMIWFWPTEGYKHSMQMVVNEASYLNRDFVTVSFLGWSPTQAVNWIAKELTGQALSNQLLDPNRYAFIYKWFNVIKGANQFALAAIYICMVCFIRAIIIIFCLPLYGLFYLIAFIDGLVIRDLRRFGGARESGKIHHSAKRLMIPSLWGSWTIYMAIPFTIHPNLIILPSVVLGSLAFWVATAFFKKYL